MPSLIDEIITELPQELKDNPLASFCLTRGLTPAQVVYIKARFGGVLDCADHIASGGTYALYVEACSLGYDATSLNQVVRLKGVSDEDLRRAAADLASRFTDLGKRRHMTPLGLYHALRVGGLSHEMVLAFVDQLPNREPYFLMQAALHLWKLMEEGSSFTEALDILATCGTY